MFFLPLPAASAVNRIARGAAALACALPLALAPQPVVAQSGTFELELNTAADAGAGCRLTYVATNNTGIALERTSYEVAVFDGNGIVSRILVLEFGAMPVSKTRVVQFDLGDLACDNLSRIVVNNQVDCVSAQGSHDFCDRALIASSRVPTIQFKL